MDAQVNSLAHFQQHSRLHFIGQWRTKAEDYLAGVYAEHPEWNHGPLARQSIFVHLDMDAYFCSVALSKEENAQYRSMPVAIAAGKHNSDVSSCNYIARQRGVRAGTWVGDAKKLCPELIVLGYDLKRCEAINEAIYPVLLSCCPPGVCMSLEVYSVDEVVIAVDTEDWDVVSKYCETVREEIFRISNGCTASCGVASNIFLARLATAKAKPNGVLVVKPEDAVQMILTTRITELHGIGRVTLRKLLPVVQAACPEGMLGKERSDPDPTSRSSEIRPPPGLIRVGSEMVTDERGQPLEDLGGLDGEAANLDDDEEVQDEADSEWIPLCQHLQAVSKLRLQDTLGKKVGEQLYHMCRGVDLRTVKRTGDAENQSLLGKTLPNAVGCSMNYAVRPTSADDVYDIVRQIISDVAAKLRRHHACAMHARLTVLERHPDYPKTTTKFMGTGRCVEHHVAVAMQNHLTGEQESELLSLCTTALQPRLRDQNCTSVGEVELPAPPQSTILIEDIRGLTLQLSALRPVMRRSDVSSEMLPRIKRAIGSGGLDGQVSLTAAFKSIRERKRMRTDADVVVVDVLDDDGCDKPDDTNHHEVVCSSSAGDDDDSVVDGSVQCLTPRLECGGVGDLGADRTLDAVVERLGSLVPMLKTQPALGGSVWLPTAKDAVHWFISHNDLASPRCILRMTMLWVCSASLPPWLYAQLHAYTMSIFSNHAVTCGWVSPGTQSVLEL